MDTFIERSNALLAARPESTRVSTRYTHKNVVRKDHKDGPLPAVAIVKTYDPVSGTVFKFRVKRINELSRILRSLGPWPVDMLENGTGVKKRGLASLMADQEYDEDKGAASGAKAPAAKNAKEEVKEEPKKKKKKGKKK